MDAEGEEATAAVAAFVGVTGVTPAAARAALRRANPPWALDNALSAYFDAGGGVDNADEIDAVRLAEHAHALDAHGRAHGHGHEQAQAQEQVAAAPPGARGLYGVYDAAALRDADGFGCALVGRPRGAPKHDARAAVSVPLRAVRVRAEIMHVAADVSVDLCFAHDGGGGGGDAPAGPLEASFVYANSGFAGSVYGLEAEIGGKVRRARCLPAERAADTYDDSIAGGHGAFLLARGDTDDTLTLSVGNLPAGAECTVRLQYVLELEIEPARDGDGGGGGGGGAWRLALSLPWTKFAAAGATTVTLSVSGVLPAPVAHFESPMHALVGGSDGARLDVALAGDTPPLAAEFALSIVLASAVPAAGDGAPPPLCVLSTGRAFPSHAALRVACIPELPGEDADADAPGEFVFVVDRSGSMAGSRLRQAQNALQLFLRSLPAEGVLFNIIGFGDTHEALFPQSEAYSPATLARASDTVRAMRANLGGTHLLPPLRAILRAPPRPGHPRQVFVLTDGEVRDTPRVLRLVRKHAREARVFAFGIGAEASRWLVKGLASAGGGAAEFVVSAGERLEATVLRTLARALRPPVLDLTLAADLRDDAGEPVAAVQFTPTPPPPVFAGDVFAFYAWIEHPRPFAGRIELRGRTPTGVDIAFPVDVARSGGGDDDGGAAGGGAFVAGNDALHRLAVRSLHLDRPDDKALVPLLVDYSIVSKHTSLVAVDERDEVVAGEMTAVDVNAAIVDRRAGAAAPGAHGAAAALAQMEFDGLRAQPQVLHRLVRSSERDRATTFCGMPDDFDGEDDDDNNEEGGGRKEERAGRAGGAAYGVARDRVGVVVASRRASATAAPELHMLARGKAAESKKKSGGMGVGGALLSGIGSLVDGVRGLASRPMASISGGKAAAPHARGGDGSESLEAVFHDAMPAEPPAEFESAEEDLAELLVEQVVDEHAFMLSEADSPVLASGQCSGFAAALPATAPPAAVAPAADAPLRAPLRPTHAPASPPSSASSSSSARADATAAALSDPHLRVLDRLVLLQEADGRWRFGVAMLSLLSLSADDVQRDVRAAHVLEGVPMDAVATVLVVVFLQTRHRESADEWALVVKKAERAARKMCTAEQFAALKDLAISLFG